MDESLFESPEAFLLFKQALAQAEGEDDPREQPVDGIPPFYFGDPLRPNACVPLRTASREKHLNHKTNEAVDNKELESLWHELAGSGKDEKPLVMGDDTDSKAIKFLNYEEFLACGQRIHERCNKFDAFFIPSVFMTLSRSTHGRVSINLFFDLVMRKVSIQQDRLTLCSYDSEGKGYLTESDLENYIFDQIPVLPQLTKLREDFYVTYTVYANRKFFFFLDSQRNRQIRILDLILSDTMTEFHELQEESLAPSYEHSNWFSVPYVSRVHDMYIKLDTNANGLLSKEEFMKFNEGTLTSQFVDRLYEECTTYGGELDYRGFLDFILARENPKTTQSMQYFFRALDVEHKGYLTLFTINYFWRGVTEHPLMLAHEDSVSLMNIKNEIFDMIKPADPLRITFKDLVKSGNGHIVCGILIDVTSFFAYESRENLAEMEEEK